MNNPVISTSGVSRTASNMLIFCLASQFVPTPVAVVTDVNQVNEGSVSYHINTASTTTSASIVLPIGSDEFISNDEFVREMTGFFADLAAKQEPLGAEFEKVLADHYWELLGT